MVKATACKFYNYWMKTMSLSTSFPHSSLNYKSVSHCSNVMHVFFKEARYHAKFLYLPYAASYSNKKNQNMQIFKVLYTKHAP